MSNEIGIKIDPKTNEFKQRVIEFGRKNVGKAVTFGTFEAWLQEKNCFLIETDKYWKAVFSSILKYNFELEFFYRQDHNRQIVTVFRIKN
ncbi:hypothetical protein FQS87_08150 [Enterococcus avium]|uniref:hypothetical protein n=1 Tax=Enterococcus TaxID=1350 RepID=UPI001A9733C7|nr:hypothetical protein [Enterococcus avium]MBO1139866.1 hypothetical protein [Enterococcus avium]